MNKRKIITLHIVEGSKNTHLLALCNDGTIWQSWKEGWLQVKPIPQPERSKKK